MNAYEYVGCNPTNHTDPSGLDTAGCDIVPDSWESNCVLRCCAQHDECYADLGCSASSWLKGIFDPTGAYCNIKVELCLAGCLFGSGSGQYGAKYYCAKERRYIRIPGDYPDYATAKKACDTR